MNEGVTRDLQSKICKACDTLLKSNKLVTTKSVLSILFELSSEQIDHKMEDYITRAINLWRLSKVGKTIQVSHNSLDKAIKARDPRNLYQKLVKYRKNLVKANREILFLKAKIKALNSFYTRQRQEFIMRIEGMLYK